MIDRVMYRRNMADTQMVAAHLRACDGDFVPPLSARVSIERYAEKLAERAERFEAWIEGDLVGLVAAYYNRLESGAAFVSSVSVLPGYRGSGIGAALMLQSFNHAATAGLGGVNLRVAAVHEAAIGFYTRLGFRPWIVEDEEIVLHRPSVMPGEKANKV